jgi:hypothetical protein
MDRLGRFYLHIPCHVEACENQASLERHELCSVDPDFQELKTYQMSIFQSPYYLCLKT